MKIQAELKKRMKEDSGYLITAYPKLYRKVISAMIKPFKNKDIDKIMSPEMKGMLFGPVVAFKMNLPFVSIVKGGRIPKKFILSRTFKDYTNNTKTLNIAKITVNRGDKILLVDDVFESGKSGKAIIKMIEKLGGKVVGISLVYNKLNEKNENFFKKYNFHYCVKMK